EELEHDREGVVQLGIDHEQPPGDLLARHVVAVLLRDAEGVAHELHPGEQRNRLPVCHRVSLDERDAPRPTALRELVAEPALADAGLADHADDLALAGEGAFEARLEGRHLRRATDEAREAAGPGDVEPRAEGARALELVEAYRLGHALHSRGPEIAHAEEPRDELRRALREQRLAR